MRRSGRLAKKLNPNKTIEQQETELIMKKCETLKTHQQEQREMYDHLADNFIEPLTEKAIGELRDMFGIAL